MYEKVSIIIPVYDREDHLQQLLSDLEPIKNKAEIAVVSKGTRAMSLNAGALSATRPFLWFLHADSRISIHNLEVLGRALDGKPDALHYFDLAFANDGPPQTALNAWGANMRSRLFGTPYGDQGFCIARSHFLRAGLYPEDVPYGEDLMLVWRLRQSGVRLNRIPSKLVTSARKYREHGWFNLTLLYQRRWIGMSVPEAVKLVRART
ncbi:MAG: glycosyl transferase family 2 [Thiobacillus sp.]|nr:glycosyl transferase family 2 [Thiobacillus sp.]